MSQDRHYQRREERASGRGRLALAVVWGLVALLQTPALAQGAEVDALFSRWDRPDSPGCAVGVIREGKLVYQRGYGMANLDHSIPLSEKTVFYIASTSKQFTAMSIAWLVTRGRLSLTDDIRRYLPELPRWEAPVTIGHLVHHTSGIPDFFVLFPLAGRRLEDTLSDEEILALLARQPRLHFPPGEQFQYSNSGYFLLGVIVSRITGRSLRQFAEETFFAPLGMRDTHFHDDRTRVVRRRATGYQPKADGFAIFATLFDRVGDGGLLTTIEDLARWDQNFDDARVGGREMIELALTPGRLNDGTRLTYAFGLTVREYRGLPQVSHGGIYNGFRAELLRFPTRKLSVACLCNLYNIDASRLAQSVADLYLAREYPRPAEGESAPPLATVSAEELQRRVGLYFAPETGATLELTLREGRLLASLPGSGILNQWLTPLSASRFVGTNSLRSEFDFGEAASPNERHVKVRLTPGIGQPVFRFEPATASSPSPAELQQYVGQYHSAALDVVYEVRLEEGKLQVQYRTSPRISLLPTIRDSFSGAGRNFVFQRDASGRVRGFGMSDTIGRLRVVPFLRKEE
jgi:CubicO group peptidase (beta-lactamase class C family)